MKERRIPRRDHAMTSRRKATPSNETKSVIPAGLEPHRLDAVPVTHAYLDGHLFRPAALTLRDGTQVTVRAITPEDEPRMVAFHKTLSNESVHFRYFGMPSLGFRTGHERLAPLCSTDLAREIALVADRERHDGEHEIFGVVLVLVISALFNQIGLSLGVVGHEGSTVIVVLNGLRLLRFSPSPLNPDR